MKKNYILLALLYLEFATSRNELRGSPLTFEKENDHPRTGDLSHFHREENVSRKTIFRSKKKRKKRKKKKKSNDLFRPLLLLPLLPFAFLPFAFLPGIQTPGPIRVDTECACDSIPPPPLLDDVFLTTGNSTPGSLAIDSDIFSSGPTTSKPEELTAEPSSSLSRAPTSLPSVFSSERPTLEPSKSERVRIFRRNRFPRNVQIQYYDDFDDVYYDDYYDDDEYYDIGKFARPEDFDEEYCSCQCYCKEMEYVAVFKNETSGKWVPDDVEPMLPDVINPKESSCGCIDIKRFQTDPTLNPTESMIDLQASPTQAIPTKSADPTYYPTKPMEEIFNPDVVATRESHPPTMMPVGNDNTTTFSLAPTLDPAMAPVGSNNTTTPSQAPTSDLEAEVPELMLVSPLSVGPPTSSGTNDAIIPSNSPSSSPQAITTLLVESEKLELISVPPLPNRPPTAFDDMRTLSPTKESSPPNFSIVETLQTISLRPFQNRDDNPAEEPTSDPNV